MIRRRNEEGAATVELAASIPLFVVMMLMFVQVAGVMMAQLAVQEAARAGARTLAVDGRQANAVSAAKSATGLNPSKLQVTTTGVDKLGLVRVRTTFPVSIRMPITNSVLLTPKVTAEVAMPLEVRTNQ